MVEKAILRLLPLHPRQKKKFCGLGHFFGSIISFGKCGNTFYQEVDLAAFNDSFWTSSYAQNGFSARLNGIFFFAFVKIELLGSKADCETAKYDVVAGGHGRSIRARNAPLLDRSSME